LICSPTSPPRYGRATLTTLEAALAQSDLLPALDRAIARTGQ
jgi:hypothetical protein